jgi:hypothetical protein
MEDGSRKPTNLGTGAMAGIIVAALLIACAIGGATFWYLRRRRLREREASAIEIPKADADDLKGPPEDEKTELWSGDEIPSELHIKDLGAHEIHSMELQELHGDAAKQQFMSTPVYELDRGFRPKELESSVDQHREDGR